MQSDDEDSDVSEASNSTESSEEVEDSNEKYGTSRLSEEILAKYQSAGDRANNMVITKKFFLKANELGTGATAALGLVQVQQHHHHKDDGFNAAVKSMLATCAQEVIAKRSERIRHSPGQNNDKKSSLDTGLKGRYATKDLLARTDALISDPAKFETLETQLHALKAKTYHVKVQDQHSGRAYTRYLPTPSPISVDPSHRLTRHDKHIIYKPDLDTNLHSTTGKEMHSDSNNDINMDGSTDALTDTNNKSPPPNVRSASLQGAPLIQRDRRGPGRISSSDSRRPAAWKEQDDYENDYTDDFFEAESPVLLPRQPSPKSSPRLAPKLRHPAAVATKGPIFPTNVTCGTPADAETDLKLRLFGPCSAKAPSMPQRLHVSELVPHLAEEASPNRTPKLGAHQVLNAAHAQAVQDVKSKVAEYVGVTHAPVTTTPSRTRAKLEKALSPQPYMPADPDEVAPVLVGTVSRNLHDPDAEYYRIIHLIARPSSPTNNNNNKDAHCGKEVAVSAMHSVPTTIPATAGMSATSSAPKVLRSSYGMLRSISPTSVTPNLPAPLLVPNRFYHSEEPDVKTPVNTSLFPSNTDVSKCNNVSPTARGPSGHIDRGKVLRSCSPPADMRQATLSSGGKVKNDKESESKSFRDAKMHDPKSLKSDKARAGNKVGCISPDDNGIPLKPSDLVELALRQEKLKEKMRLQQADDDYQAMTNTILGRYSQERERRKEKRAELVLLRNEDMSGNESVETRAFDEVLCCVAVRWHRDRCI
jgi:hypothetical protein